MTLINHSLKGALLAGTIISGFAFAAPAIAQTAPQQVETVTVTGSRIGRKDYVSPSPITTVGAAKIEATGSLNIEQVLNSLPQVVPGLTAASNNPSDGTATVDLRGLGPSRTLVLVNGHRMTPATKASSAIDLNAIPAALIKKVEVVTGGASATYGSDALAGVVNFIMKDDFEGLQITGQAGQTAEGDGNTSDISAIFGTNFADGKGNITTFASFTKRDQVLAAAREWAVFSNAGGSATGITGRADNVALNPYNQVAVASGCNSGDATNNIISFAPNGAARGFCNDFDMTAAVNDRYNFAPVNNLMSPGTRVSTAVFGKYDFSDNLTGKVELFYTDNRQSSQLAPTPMTGLEVAIDNPFVSPSFAAILAARPTPGANFVFRKRMVDVGARVQDHNNKQFQFMTGLNGVLASGFKWDVTGTFGRTEFKDSTYNDVSRSRLVAATRGASFGATQTSCGAAQLAIFPTCVPFNLFGAGSASKAAIDFVRLNFSDTTVFERSTVTANLAGSLFEVPAGSVDFAIGAEYRKDDFKFEPDVSHGSGDIFGFNAERPVAGGFDVQEFYGEVSIPLLKDLPFIKSISTELGGRYSKYSSVGVTSSYKAGLDWEVVDGVRLRAMYQRASRAPSSFELFQSGDQGFPAFTDPCSTRNVNTGAARTLSAQTIAFCTLQMGVNPVTAGFVQPNSQIESSSYGNTNLDAETSETKTFGLVWRPSYVPSLAVTLDYYDIVVEDFINTKFGGASGVVNACFASNNLTSSACFNTDIGLPAVYRISSGELKVRTSLGNVSEFSTKGFDFTLEYNLPIDALVKDTSFFDDKIGISFLLNRLDSYILDGVEYSGTAGAYNISATLPDYKATLSATYRLGKVKLTWNSNYYAEMDNQGNIPDFQDGGYNTVPEYLSHDIQARWALRDKIELFGGIKNVFDKEPPVFDNSPDGNTDPNAFDALGRAYYVGFKVNF